MGKGKDSVKKRVYSLFLIFLLLILIFSFFYKQILQKIGDLLIVEDELYPVDVIHVIAGDDYRTEYAISLYLEGYTKYIFFTGGLCKIHGYYHGQHAQKLSISKGVPENALFFDDSQVRSTFDETLLLKKWIDSLPDNVISVMIVSDPFHMRRAKWTNKKILGGEMDIIMAPVPIDQTPFNLRWWQDKASKNYILEEYIKIIYYFLRYQLSITWLGEFDTE